MRMEAIAEYQKQVQEEKNVYSEIRVPLDFSSKFEMDKNMDQGSIMYADREVQDELRIRYLQHHSKQLVEYHDRQMKEVEIRNRTKMHQYCTVCLGSMAQDLKVEIKLLCAQFDDKIEESDRKDKRIWYLEAMMIKYENEITELRDLVFYEPLAHAEWTEKLQNSVQDPLLLQDLTSMRTENMANVNLYGIGEYYKSLLELSPIEKETLDLSKPF